MSKYMQWTFPSEQFRDTEIQYFVDSILKWKIVNISYNYKCGDNGFLLNVEDKLMIAMYPNTEQMLN